MTAYCEHCARDAGIYDKTRRCCQVRLIANMPREHRQGYYKQVERTSGKAAVNALIEEVNVVLQAKRVAKLQGEQK
jgi:hypothetical protein